VYSDATNFTEIFTTTALPLVFSTNNTQRARIDSDGTFRVKGAGTAGTTDAFQVAGAAPASAMALDSAARLSLLTANGQMGFASGNTAGGVKIQAFNAAGNADGYLAFEGFTIAYGRFSADGTFRVKGAGTAGSTDAFQVAGTAPANSMVLNSSGNLGVGTASPNNILTAQADATGASFADNGVAQIIARGNTDSTKRLGLGIDTTNNIGVIQAQKFGTGTYPLAINPAGGDVGIGTASPAAKLHVVGSSGSGAIQIGTSAGANQYQYITFGGSIGGTDFGWQVGRSSNTAGLGGDGAFYFYDIKANATRMSIDSSGNLLVGAATAISSGSSIVNLGTARQVLTIKGDSEGSYTQGIWSATTIGDNLFAYFGTETSLSVRGSISYNRAGGVVLYNTTSDYRAKDIIGPVQNPGATIDALKVYEGQMKGATQSRPMLIAHEAQAFTPYAVTGEKDALNEDGTPKYQQMDVSSLVPLLLAELQALRARVAALEAA